DVDGSVVNVTQDSGAVSRLFMGEYIAENIGTTTLNISAALNVQPGYMVAGRKAGTTSIVNIYEGAAVVAKGFGIGDIGTGIMNMYGGTLTTGFGGGSAGEQVGIAGPWNGAGSGTVNLYGGVWDVSGARTGLRLAWN